MDNTTTWVIPEAEVTTVTSISVAAGATRAAVIAQYIRQQEELAHSWTHQKAKARTHYHKTKKTVQCHLCNKELTSF